MNSPTREQVKESFYRGYYDENKTYEGVEDAFVWFLDPRIVCAIETAKRAGSKKCKAPCPFCKGRVN